MPDILLEFLGAMLSDLIYNNNLVFTLGSCKQIHSLFTMWQNYWESKYNFTSLHSFCPNCVCVLSAQLCLTLHRPVDCNPPGSSVHGMRQARVLEWGTICLLPGIFPHLLRLLHWQGGSLPLAPPGKPPIILWMLQVSSSFSVSLWPLF